MNSDISKYTYKLFVQYFSQDELDFIDSIMNNRGNWRKYNDHDLRNNAPATFFFVYNIYNLRPGEAPTFPRAYWNVPVKIISKMQVKRPEIADKDIFSRELNRYFPELKAQYLPKEYVVTINNYTKLPADIYNNDTYWIIKPAQGLAGKGIKVTTTYNDYKQYFINLIKSKSTQPQTSPMQKYQTPQRRPIGSTQATKSSQSSQSSQSSPWRSNKTQRPVPASIPTQSYSSANDQLPPWHKDKIKPVQSTQTTSATEETSTFFIISNYIKNPLLINNIANNQGYKFHLRVPFIYFLQNRNNPAIGFVCNRSLIFTAREPYKYGDWDNKNIHDSHLSSSFNQALVYPDDLDVRNSDGVEHIRQENIMKIDQAIDKISYGVLKTVDQYRGLSSYDNVESSFYIFGLDLLIDDDYNVWLLEINHNAAIFNYNSDFKKDFIAGLISKIVDPYYPPANPVLDNNFFRKVEDNNLVGGTNNNYEHKYLKYKNKYIKSKVA